MSTSNLVMHTRAFNCSCLSLGLWIWCMSFPVDYLFIFLLTTKAVIYNANFRSQSEVYYLIPIEIWVWKWQYWGSNNRQNNTKLAKIFWVSRHNIYCSIIIKNNVLSIEYAMIIANLLRYFMGLKSKCQLAKIL